MGVFTPGRLADVTSQCLSFSFGYATVNSSPANHHPSPDVPIQSQGRNVGERSKPPASSETTLLKSSFSVHLHVLPSGTDFRGFLWSPHSQSGSHSGVICPFLSDDDFFSTMWLLGFLGRAICHHTPVFT